ncbi:hypothetical protein RHS01_04100 [Rhizoctonia solani]|uniref:Uncharacterized protein n=1 Tax=Rhizoctonia solani TaxID=456999 RepID=A0A8H7IFE5_9AGAM|nr:hypothetical protein RHS01_04100 [Rhizoctonia solani]
MSSPRSEYSDASYASEFDAASVVYRPMNTCDMAKVETLHPDWPVALEPEVDLLSLAVGPEYRRHHIAENLIKAVTASLVNTCRFKAGEEGALVHADIRCGHVNRAFFEQGMAWQEDKEFQGTLPWARCDATRFVTRVAV